MTNVNRKGRPFDDAFHALLAHPVTTPSRVTVHHRGAELTSIDFAEVRGILAQYVDGLYRNAIEAPPEERWAMVTISAYEDEDFDWDDPAFTMTLDVWALPDMQDLPWPDEWFAGRRRAGCVPGLDLPKRLNLSKLLRPYSWSLEVGQTVSWDAYLPFTSPELGATIATGILAHAMAESRLTVATVSLNSDTKLDRFLG